MRAQQGGTKHTSVLWPACRLSARGFPACLISLCLDSCCVSPVCVKRSQLGLNGWLYFASSSFLVQRFQVTHQRSCILL